jgi:tetratricopeptide (TPR) repeat protein
MSNPMVLKAKSKGKQFEKTVIEFAAKDNGSFFAVSHDATFLRNFRQTLNKELVIGADVIRTSNDTSKFLAEAKSPLFKDKQILLVIERILDGKNVLPFIRQFKETYDKSYIIVLTTEVEKNVLVLLHEVGADNFITKPASMDTIIEKIAFTIRPQSKLGQMLDTAKDYLARGKADDALLLCEKILSDVKPGSAAALMIQGDAYKRLGKPAEAATAYGAAADGAQMYLEPLKRLAELYKEQGDLDNQLAFLEKLDKLSPLNVERKVDMGEIHVKKGDTQRAEALFDEAMKNATKEAMGLIEDVKRSIAERCMDAAPEMAERFFRSIIENKGEGLSRADLSTFNRLGMALRRQGKWNQAVEEYQKALSVSPNDENLLFNMAVAYTEGGEHGQAINTLEKALSNNPTFFAESTVICFNIGVMYLNARDRKRAKLFLKKTLELDPGHQGAQRLLSNLG